MFGRKNTDWRRLSQSFPEKVSQVNTDILAAGHLILPPSSKFWVRVHPGLDGIVVKRGLVPILFATIEIRWSDIGTITEYDSGIRGIETAVTTATQTNAYVSFKNSSNPNVMMPWCMEITDLLPDFIGYQDCKHIFWGTALERIAGNANR